MHIGHMTHFTDYQQDRNRRARFWREARRMERTGQRSCRWSGALGAPFLFLMLFLAWVGLFGCARSPEESALSSANGLAAGQVEGMALDTLRVRATRQQEGGRLMP